MATTEEESATVGNQYVSKYVSVKDLKNLLAIRKP